MSLKPPEKDYFNWYKTNISLPDFARDHYGFVSRGDKSTINYPFLMHPQTGSKFIFKLNSRGQYTFFCPLDDSFRGNTIWDFVRHMESQLNPGRELLTFVEIKTILDEYINSRKYLRPGESMYQMKGEQKPSVFSPYDLSPLTDLTYLESRMITRNTINHAYFKGKIFNHYHAEPEKGISFVNTAFVMTDTQGNICALSLKNRSSKGEESKYQHIQGSRSSGLFLSTNTGKLDNLFVVESGVDALSHFQMNANDFAGKSILYASSEGSLCEGQLLRLQQIIENQKPSQVNFAFDNDIAGHLYSIHLLGSLNYSAIVPGELSVKLPRLIVKPIVQASESLGKIFIQFDNGSKQEGVERIQWLKGKLEEYNQRFTSSYIDSQAYSIRLNELSDHMCQGLISFENNISLWGHMGGFIHYLRFDNSPVFKRDLPLSKDWNEDLQIMLDTHPKYKLGYNDKNEPIAILKHPQKLSGAPGRDKDKSLSL